MQGEVNLMQGGGGTVYGSLPDLRKKLREDMLTYYNDVLKLDKPLKSVKDFNRVLVSVDNDLWENADMKNGVSDIVGRLFGATYRRI